MTKFSILASANLITLLWASSAAAAVTVEPRTQLSSASVSASRHRTYFDEGRSQESQHLIRSTPTPAAGAGLDLGFQLGDDLEIGLGAGFVDYAASKRKSLDYREVELAVFANYDFWKNDRIALYGSVGASVHSLKFQAGRVRHSDQDIVLTSEFATAQNYDLGVGMRSKISDKLSLSFAYRFSDSFQGDDVSFKYGDATDTSYQIDNVGFKKDELQLGLASLL